MIQANVGDKIKMLTILELLPNSRVSCQCECGNIKTFYIHNIKNGKTVSCGCYNKKIATKRLSTHGLTKHPLFKVWGSMIGRCYIEKDTHYAGYGGRGIKICEEWRNDFKTFYDWCIANGWQKGLEVDRHPDNNGNYEPTNCRIATRKQNCRNKRNNRLVTFNGETKSLTDWAEEKGINYFVLHSRLRYNWPVSRLFNPVQKRAFISH